MFIDRVNEKNPIKNVGLIEATNPCGEQPLHPFDSCNLGSINLGALVKGEGASSHFDWDEYKSIIHTTTRFLDNVIEVNKYPLPQIDNMSKTTRRIGLGVMGFADALYKLNIAYNSEQGTAFGEKIMQVLNDESHMASEILADERGVFPAWEGSDWEKVGRRLRNSYTTTVAPTGTISIIANCSGGIEPMFSLAFIRQVMKDNQGRPTIMREVNYVFDQISKNRGFYSDEMIDDIVEKGTLAYRSDIPDDIKRVFVTAHDISPYWHMKMQSAASDCMSSSLVCETSQRCLASWRLAKKVSASSSRSTWSTRWRTSSSRCCRCPVPTTKCISCTPGCWSARPSSPWPAWPVRRGSTAATAAARRARSSALVA